MTAEQKLKELGFTLPLPTTPIANYVPAVRVGDLLFVSGHGPFNDGRIRMSGKLGQDLTVEGFKDQPKVVNGCSDLLVAVFGENGKHARSAVGMQSLPNQIPVEIEMILEVG
jgi:enamine deaminase RidA (YjgF/YER057c/UK114 family)